MLFSTPRLAALTLAASALFATGTAQAIETVDLFYHVKTAGISMDGIMGYSGPDGFVSLAGEEIVSASVIVNFRPERGTDWDTFHMAMVVPTIGAESQYFAVEAAQMVMTKPGVYSYTLTTDLFNGTVTDGRFSIEAYGTDRFGNPIGLGGKLSADTGYYFTVTAPAAAVPEPGTAAMLSLGLLALPLLARRRKSN